jgi:hypothetical protein
MKTNVILKSSDRNLFGVPIRQETKTQMLNVSDLQNAYETARFENGWNEQNIASLMQGKAFKERVYYVLEKQGFIKVEISMFMESVKSQGISKVLKSLGVWKTTGARQTKTVFCNPYIWVLLAMELNPKIYATVVMWLTDSLVFNRLEAGTEYLPMNDAISNIIEKPQYFKYAILINKKVFGKHVSGMRNLANTNELRKIADLEKTVITAIENNWIKTESDLIKFLNK